MTRRTRSISSRRTAQRGMTLVELMVGVALSMITVLAAMVAYKALIHNSVSSSNNSKQHNVAAGLSIQLSRLLPQAGWGVGATASPAGGAANTDVVLLSGAAVSGVDLSGTAVAIGAAARTGNAVIWDSAVSGTVECSALVIPAAGGLVYLGPQPCANAAAWATLDWTNVVHLLPADALTGASFSSLKTTCWPYAAVPGGQTAVQVTLTGSKSVATTACMTNITN